MTRRMVATNSRAAGRWTAIGASSLALAGCPTPAQEGGLARVDTAGAARRLEMMCGAGHRGPSCAPPRDASGDDVHGDRDRDGDHDRDHDRDRDHDHDRDHDRDHDHDRDRDRDRDHGTEHDAGGDRNPAG
jgi:hypothetical protein